MSHDELQPDTLQGRGRLVMYGGDPYEDDLEPAEPEPCCEAAAASCGPVIAAGQSS